MPVVYQLEFSENSLINDPFIVLHDLEFQPNINIGDKMLYCKDDRLPNQMIEIFRYFKENLNLESSSDIEITVIDKGHFIHILDFVQCHTIRLSIQTNVKSY